MTIPKQIEEAAEMAEELMAEINPEEKQDTDKKPEEGQAVEPETPEEPEEPETPEEPEEPEEPEDPETPAAEESWEQKYKTLKGKYDSEVPRFRTELEQFKAQVFERLGQEKEPEKPEEAPEIPEAAQKFLEEYGDDYAEGLKAYTEYITQQVLKENLQPVTERINKSEESQVRAAQAQFADYLDDKVQGDWRSLWSGENQEFEEFLKQPDPSGLYTNEDLVRLYNDNWDADRLAVLFNGFFGADPSKVAEANQPKPKKPVETARVAPKRRSAEEPKKSSSDARIWTKESIAEFQEKDRRGEFEQEESDRLWNDLLMAPSENRIR